MEPIKPQVDCDVAAYFDPEEREASKHDDISLDEVRRATSGIRGSLADTVIESREERFPDDRPSQGIAIP